MASDVDIRPGGRTSLFVILLVAGIWALCLQAPVVWRVTGIGQTSVPFLDLYGLLAAGEVAQAHGDPFQPNPLDPFHRPHVYTAWWLVSGAIGLTRADTEWLGLALAGLSLVAAVALIRPGRKKEAVLTTLVLCSPAVLMAVNRGNNDLVVLVIICAALGCLRTSSPVWRALGIILLAAAAALKYYPLAAAVVLLGARTRRELGAALGLLVAVLVLAWPALQPGLISAARFKPHPEGLYAFGAPTLFRDFGFHSPAGWLSLSALMGAVIIISLVRGSGQAEPAGEQDPAVEREFVCGAAMITGVFFLGASFVYKLIFAVWLLPALWREAPGGIAARSQRAIKWLLLAVLWLEGVLALVINLVLTPLSLPLAHRALDATLVVSQLLTWGLVGCLVRELGLYGIRRIRFFWPAKKDGSLPA